MATSPLRAKRVAAAAAAGGCGVGGPNEGRAEKKHKTCFVFLPSFLSFC